MVKESKEASEYCRGIRARLVDYLNNRLGLIATGEVEGHMLGCQGCSVAYSDLILEEIDNGREPLREPPFVPPIKWYDDYLKQRANRFGVFWDSIKEAMKSADAKVKKLAGDQLEQLSESMRGFMIQPTLATRGAQTGGPVRVRGADSIDAEVISSTEGSSRAGVTFTVLELPRIVKGRLYIRLQTDAGREGQSLICTLLVDRKPAVSFKAPLEQTPGEAFWNVDISEEVPWDAGHIPSGNVKLTVVEE